jgi:hypothetical protein
MLFSHHDLESGSQTILKAWNDKQKGLLYEGKPGVREDMKTMPKYRQT